MTDDTGQGAILWRAAKTNGDGSVQPRIYWATRSRCPTGKGIIAFTTDDKPQFMYEAFNTGRDFGPLDLARTVTYCRWIDALFTAHAGCGALVHLVPDESPEERANAAVLCGAYRVLADRVPAVDAFHPFRDEPFPPFLDCRGGSSAAEIGEDDGHEFGVSVLEVLSGLENATNMGWLDYFVYDVEEHLAMLHAARGDMSWLLPGKALAMASPWSQEQDQDGLPACTPQTLVPYLLQHNVKLVVQCNCPEREEEGERRRMLVYDPDALERAGVRHLRLPFEDGGCPSVDLIHTFLEEVEAVNGAFAVHCRSGLGRTATLIGIYAMRHMGFTARHFIAWSRVVRPGTVHGSQQQYLVNLEPHVVKHSSVPLQTLGERERLLLLPRRELRFWALDLDIAAAQTRGMSVPDIIDAILSVKAGRAEVEHVSGTGVARAVPQRVPGGGSTPRVPEHGATPPNRVAECVASDCDSLSVSAKVLAKSKLGTPDGDDWDEVLRYLQLFRAVQSEGALSWDSVRSHVDLLRVLTKPGPKAPSVDGIAALQAARQAAMSEGQRRDAELATILHESQNVQREIEELKQQLAQEREVRAAERANMQDTLKTSSRELETNEKRLETASSGVELLRCRAMRQGGLEAWQMERVDGLRRDILQTREETIRHKVRGELAQSRRGVADPPTPPRRESYRRDGLATTVPLSQSWKLGVCKADSEKPTFSEAKAGGVPNAASEQGTDSLSWDSVRQSIERLRDKCHQAAKEARREREAAVRSDACKVEGMSEAR